MLCIVLGLAACQSSLFDRLTHFGPLAKRLADKEVYPIVEEKQVEVLGQSQPFSIEPDKGPLYQKTIDDAGFTSDQYSSGGLTLTLPDAMALSIDNNYDYQQRKESLYLAALNLTGAKHEFSPIFSGAVSARATRQGQADGPVERFGEAVTDLAVTKLFATGARVTVGLTNDFLRFTTGPSPSISTGQLSASIVQPLLQGAGMQVNLENLKQSERDVIYAVRDFDRYRKSFIIDRVNDYFRVLQASDENENEYRSYHSLIIARKRAEAMEKADRMARFEVDQALQDEIRARNRWLNARTSYEQQLDQFKINLGLPTDVNIELGLTLEQAEGQALTGRLDYLTSRDQAEDAGRRVGINENSLLPVLDARVDLTLNDRGRNAPLDFDWNTRSDTGRLDLELPLDRKTERNDYRQASIALQRSLREAQRKRNNVLAEVRSAFRDVQDARQSYEIQVTSLKLAERRVKNIAMLFAAGRSGITIRDQLDAEDDVRTARNAVTDQLVNDTIARLGFYNSIEALQIDEKGNWHENDQLGN